MGKNHYKGNYFLLISAKIHQDYLSEITKSPLVGNNGLFNRWMSDKYS